MEKKNEQICNVIRSCSREFSQINDKYQKMKEQQMDILQDISDATFAKMSGSYDPQIAKVHEMVSNQMNRSMDLYSEDHLTDQQFLLTIQDLNRLLPDECHMNENLTPRQLGDGCQQAIDDLLSSLNALETA